jgi:hypothetical protein
MRPPRQQGKSRDGAGEVDGDQAAQGRAPTRRREPRQEVDEGNQDAVADRLDSQLARHIGDAEEHPGGAEGEEQADPVELRRHAERQQGAVPRAAGHGERDGGGPHGQGDRRHEERHQVAPQLSEKLGRDRGGGRHRGWS